MQPAAVSTHKFYNVIYTSCMKMIHRTGNAEKFVNFRLSLIEDFRYAEDADKQKLLCLTQRRKVRKG